MKYTTNIHKNKLYVRPKPYEDIKSGLVLLLSQPLSEGNGPFVSTDLVAGRKRYDLPKLPEGVWIVGAFVKNGGK